MDKINSIEYKSRNYEVKTKDRLIHVFDTPVLFDGIDETRMIHHPYISSYALFTIEQETEIFINALLVDEIFDIKVQPESKSIKYELLDNTIRLKINPKDKICVTVNGKINQMLMLFANTPEEKPDGDVLYFGPGEHYITDNERNILYLKSGQTLHIAEGAILYARLEAKDAENVKITGNGILCGSRNNGRWGAWLRPMVGSYDTVRRKVLTDFVNCKNLTIENVTFIDADEWTIRVHDCENVDVSGINIIGYQSNSDGIDICSTKNAKIKDCFVRTSDDCIVVKSHRNARETENFEASGCVLWADRASALEIGHEICKDIHNIRFRDIDILNQIEETYGYHAIDITDVDEGNVYDVHYENIRIEDCRRILGIRIREGRFSNPTAFLGNGRIFDITFKNITSNADKAIFISGRNEESKVENINFEDFYIKGEKILDFEKFRFNPYVENIRIKGQKSEFEKYPEFSEYKTLDIRPMCNMILGHNRGIYGLAHPDWITMPSGVNILEGIPFEIAGQGYCETGGDYKRCVVPKERIRIEADTVLDTEFSAKWLFFLHTGVNILSEIDKALLRYKITYEDGTKTDIIIKNQNDCNEWNTWSLGGWQPVYNSIRMYIKPWKNPNPEKKITKIELSDGEVCDLGVLLAISYS